MSSADGRGADPEGLGQASELPGEQVHTQLVETLVLVLIEKAVLTKNDALNIVQTVALVQGGAAADDANSGALTQANLQMLQRMYGSFEAIADRPGVREASWGNVHRLRPPIHGDYPEFPRDD